MDTEHSIESTGYQNFQPDSMHLSKETTVTYSNANQDNPLAISCPHRHVFANQTSKYDIPLLLFTNP